MCIYIFTYLYILLHRTDIYLYLNMFGVYSPNRACYCMVLADLRAIGGHPSQRASRTTKQIIIAGVL